MLLQVIYCSLYNYIACMNLQNLEYLLYFDKIQNQSKIKKQKLRYNISTITDKINKQLNQGQLEIKPYEQQIIKGQQKLSKLDQSIRQKNKQFNKQLNLLTISLRDNIHPIKNIKSQRGMSFHPNKLGTQVTSQDLEEYKKRRIEATIKLKQLKKQRDLAYEQRKLIQKRKQQKQNVQNKIRLEQQQKLNQKLKQQKLQAIQDKIRKFDQNREIRLSRLKSSAVSSSTSNIPKYKQAQIDFQNQQQRKSHQKYRRYKENIRQKFKQYGFDNIKAHQKDYLQYMKEKFGGIKTRSKTQHSISDKKQQGFKIMRRQEQIEQAKIKREKMKQFQKLSHNIRVNVNTQKSLQIQITKDRAQNPMKYNFLRQKNLSDYQIFKDFRNFQIQIDGKRLGNSYLKQIINKNKSNTKHKQNSTQKIKTQSSEAVRKTKYKNYLEQAKKHASKKKPDQFQQLYKQYGDKSKVLQALQEKSELERSQALQKIAKIRKMKTYQQQIQLEKDIDQDYIKSIKSKIKCIQLK